jgi:hypothetical protein
MPSTQRRIKIDLESIFLLTGLADYIIPFTIRAICDLGVADRLADGPRSIEDLAKLTGTHAPSLYRALRALACKEVFAEVEPGVFDLTPMAQFLRADHPLSLKDAYSLIPADIEAWANLDFSVRTGQAAFDHTHGCGYWEYMRANPEQADRFDRSQQAQTGLELRVFLRAYDWGAFSTLVDVGGGNGSFLAGLLARFTGVHGVLFDQPEVVSRARAAIGRLSVSSRCDLVGGDFFESVPSSADAYLLKRVLYGWHDADAVQLLKTIRAAMRNDSRLLIIEPLDEPGGGTDIARRYDLAMLVMKGSGARTREHIAELCNDARLRVASVTDTFMFPIMEVQPVS